MRVLLLGSHMNYNLEHYTYMNLLKLGHDVEFYGYQEKLGKLANPVRIGITRSKKIRVLANFAWLNKLNDEIKKKVQRFTPDLILSIKGEAIKPETVEWMKSDIGAKTALWYPDDPRFFDSLVKYISASYNYIFTASERAIKIYRDMECENVYFLPFACEPTVHRRTNLTEEDRMIYRTDVLFVGTYTHRRARLVKALEKAGIKVKVYGPYWKYFKLGSNVYDGIYGPELVKAFNAAKVVLNIHVDSDVPYKVNMRTFEATGSGAFLLTDIARDLETFFKTREEIMVFNDTKELLSLSNYYLRNVRERDDIANAGYARCSGDHTFEKRLRNLIEVVD
jgi:spore maturation protein CgeB